MTQKAMTLDQVCQTILCKLGSQAVRDFVDGMDGVVYHYCRACEIEQPFYNKCCLICGTQRRPPRHTPGPWEVDEGLPIIINSTCFQDARHGDGSPIVCIVEMYDEKEHPYCFDPDVALANAKLIAKAPDMLGAIEAILVAWESGDPRIIEITLNRAGVLLAQAKGEA